MLKSAVHALSGRLRAALQSPRAWILFLLTFSLCLKQSISLQNRLSQAHYTMHLDEMLFMHLFGGCNMPYMSVLFLLLLDEATLLRGDAIQRHRGSFRWLGEQVCSCFTRTAGMLCLVIVLVFFCALPHAARGSGWSEPAYVQNGQIEAHAVLVPPIVTASAGPLRATLLSLFIIFLFWFSMALCLRIFARLNAPVAGVLLYGFLLFPRVTLLSEYFPRASLFFPDSNFTLYALLQKPGAKDLLSVCRSAAVGYGIVILMLVLTLYASGKLHRKADCKKEAMAS